MSCQPPAASQDFANGTTLDREGRMVHCEHGTRRIARTEFDGTRVGLVVHHDAKRLNSPNDVVVKSDGTIWFTDQRQPRPGATYLRMLSMA